MKIKFARTLAIASALSVAFAGLTAFAAAGVETITTYDYTAADSASVTVTTTVTGLKDGAEVAYYVCKEGTAGAVTNDIVYIDQGTYDKDAGKLEFKFTDTKAEFITAMAKFGTDTAKADDETTVAFPTFYFNDGTNLLTEASAGISATDAEWGKDLTLQVVPEGEEVKDGTTTDGDDYKNLTVSKAYKGIVSGNVKEYGVAVKTTGTDTYYFPAAGCDAATGAFVVVIEGDLPADTGSVVPYYIDADGEYAYGTVTTVTE